MLFNKKPTLAWYTKRKPYNFVSYDLPYFAVLEKIAKEITQANLRFPNGIKDDYELAYMCTGYLEDFISEIGYWQTIREKNKELYGTPVPFFYKQGSDYNEDDMNVEDICLIIWYFKGLTSTNLHNPQNPDIEILANEIFNIMIENYDKLDATAFYDEYYQVEDGDSEDWGKFKRKCNWFANNSPFTCYECSNYLAEEMQPQKIAKEFGAEFNFITANENMLFRRGIKWHGRLGIDMFADMLKGDKKTIQQVREFTRKDCAAYYLKEKDSQHFHFINTFTRQKYLVPLHSITGKMNAKCYYYGGFIRWGSHLEMNGNIFGGWEQSNFGVADDLNDKFQQEFYYYVDSYKQSIDEMIDEQKVAFQKAFGTDLIIHHSAKEFHESLYKFDVSYYENVVKDKSQTVDEYIKQYGMSTKLIKEFGSKTVLSMYFNPKMGMEYLEDFGVILSVLKKKNQDLTNSDKNELASLLLDDSFSGQFLQYFINNYDCRLLFEFFGIDSKKEFEFAIRYFKNHDFRTQPPRLSLYGFLRGKEWTLKDAS